MRERILTEAEKRAIRQFLENGISSDMIRTIRHRARKFLPIFKEEIALLEKFLRSQ